MDHARLLARWVALCALAEFLGIAAAGLWYGGVSALFGEPAAIPARVIVWLLMSLAAVPEGVVLGGLQAIGLRWFLPGVSAGRWVLATIAVGLLGWGIGTFIPMFVVADGTAGDAAAELGLAATAAYAAIFGLAVGVVFGAAQAWALPRAVRGRVRWVVANAVGWGVGLPLIYVGAQIGGDFPDWPTRIALWAGGGLAAGAAVGLATGIALDSMAGAGLRRVS